MSLLKQLSLAAVFAASLFFVSDALADEKEKNPFTKEINVPFLAAPLFSWRFRKKIPRFYRGEDKIFEHFNNRK